MWGGNTCENASGCPSGSDYQIKRSEMLYLGLEMYKLSVAGHATQKEQYRQ